MFEPSLAQKFSQKKTPERFGTTRAGAGLPCFSVSVKPHPMAAPAVVVKDVGDEAAWGAAWSSCAPGTLIALDFRADWAAPCAQMDALFAQLAPLIAAPPAVQAWKVDADGCAGAVSLFKVEAVPTFLCVRVKEGKRAFETVGPRVDGADPAALGAAFQSWKGAAQAAKVETQTTQASLDARLRQLLSAHPVMLFMKGNRDEPKCGFSRQMVELLGEEKIDYQTFDILSDEEVRQGLKAFSNWPTYPQLYANGELLGGLDIVKELMAEGELKDALSTPSLDDRLKALINTSKVMLFMKGVPEDPQCGFSRQAVALLNKHSVAFGSFNILSDDAVRQGLKAFSNWPTYPQLYANGELVGGLDILKELEAEGELKEALGA
jgi:Grx4 family monothiol glutaredoxin